MISALFKRDYAQLTARGVVFTPEDIVRLNALAVKVRLSKNAAQTVHLPRLAFMPADSWWRAPLILREPTIAHELWMEEAGRWIDTGDDRNFLWLNGYALSQKAEALVDAFNPKKLVKTVYTFAAKRLCSFTREQLSSAVEYVLFGADWTVGEKGGEKGGEVEKEGGEVERCSGGEVPLHHTTTPPLHPSPTIGLLVNGLAHRLPISLDDAKRMTASDLTEAISRARLHDGDFDAEDAMNEAMREYVRARSEIEKRSTRTTEAAPSEPTGQG